MRKIYYEDQYKKEFVAEVESIEEIHGKYHVRLNETAFFPGGGGQQNDLGFIENIPVIDVYEKSGEVYHVLDKKLIKIQILFYIDLHNIFFSFYNLHINIFSKVYFIPYTFSTEEKYF